LLLVEYDDVTLIYRFEINAGLLIIKRFPEFESNDIKELLEALVPSELKS
jgi:hypothetical protein